MKQEELTEQIKFINWCRYESSDDRTKLIFAIPNGGHRGQSEARKLKASGTLAGVPDLFLPVAAGGHHGLFLEFKTKTGRLSQSQKTMIKALMDQGFAVAVPRSAEHAISCVKHYLSEEVTVLPAEADTTEIVEQKISEAISEDSRKLNLSWLGMTSLPESIQQLVNLVELNLRGNQLTDLPESTGQLKNLKKLDLIGNQLTSLPESIGQLESLEVLDLGDNQLTSLPESIGQLGNLAWLYLNGNRLTRLPESIGELEILKGLDLSDNQLISLPESIECLRNLKWLALNGNQSTKMPEAICKLKANNCNVVND